MNYAKPGGHKKTAPSFPRAIGLVRITKPIESDPIDLLISFRGKVQVRVNLSLRLWWISSANTPYSLSCHNCWIQKSNTNNDQRQNH